jgi:hypothetical protein
MPRFYFDVREGEKFTPDEEGLDLASLEAAKREFKVAAAAIGHERLPKEDAREVMVKVRDAGGRRVFFVTVTMTTCRTVFAPT